MATPIQWLAPSPLWNEFAAAADKTAFRSPALLRFATDTFMQDLQSLLASAPGNLRQYIAQPETWQAPNAGLPPPGSVASGPNAGSPLKLFQAVHQRFYLVAASLNCRLPGLPDRTVRTNQGERTTFVLRRLALPQGVTQPVAGQTYDEYAWTAAGPVPGWIPADAAGIAPGEEQNPLFSFQFPANGGKRRLFGGLIPVGKRQAFVTGRTLQAQPGGVPQPAAPDDARKIEFQAKVLDPWADLVTWYNTLSTVTTGDDFGAAEGSAFILIDFANYLSTYLQPVWAAVQDPSQASALTGAQRDLYNAFSATMRDVNNVARYTLAQALVMANTAAGDFENQTFAPGVSLALPAGYAGPMLSDEADAALVALIGRPSTTLPLPQRQIQTLVEAALDQAGPAPPSAVTPPAKDPQNPQGNDWYVVRCVYERPQCAVMTLPAIPAISPPSQPFQIASYFDPDAPARMTTVALPVDTTPAALRKYPKGVGFMISDQLSQQMKRVQGLDQLMKGQVADANSSGYGLGMICSLSIPIITICAFLVLMIFLILLNIIFFWLPFFKICFPIPTLKAKGS